MVITIAVAAGVAHIYMIVFSFALMWTTMTYGYFTEVLSRPEPPASSNEMPTQWVIRPDNPSALAFPDLPFTAVLQRLFPHLMGWVPYICVWVVLMHSFLYNTSDGTGPPAFVHIIVWGQFTTFTLFGFTQLANQIAENGPSWYFWGEMSYLFLSLFAKGLLGLTLVSSVLLYDTFEEAAAAAS